MHVHQVVDQPEIRLNVDRIKASQLGLTQRDVTSNMLISLSGNGTVAPNFWVNWANGVNYNVGVQTPQYKVDSLDALLRTPISSLPAVKRSPRINVGAPTVATPSSARRPAERRRPTEIRARSPAARSFCRIWSPCKRGYTPVIVNHYNVWPVFDVYANVDRRDLGGVGAEVEKIMQDEDGSSAARHHARSARPDPDHAIVLLPPGPRNDLRRQSWSIC